jgi:tetratricopeptide (TPR) repeat protein
MKDIILDFVYTKVVLLLLLVGRGASNANEELSKYQSSLKTHGANYEPQLMVGISKLIQEDEHHSKCLDLSCTSVFANTSEAKQAKGILGQVYYLHIQEANQHPDFEPIPVIDAILKYFPGIIYAHVMKVHVLVKRDADSFDLALSAARDLLELHPAHNRGYELMSELLTIVDHNLRWRPYASFCTRQIDMAMSRYGLSLKLLKMRAHCFLAGGYFSKAKIDAEAALNVTKTDFKLWHTLCTSEKRLGNFEAALTACYHGVNIAPTEPEVRPIYFQILEILMEIGLYEPAFIILQKMSSISESFFNDLKELQKVAGLKGMLMHGLGESYHSLNYLQLALDLGAKNTEYLSESYAAMGRFDKSSNIVNQEITETNSYAYFRRELHYYLWSQLDIPMVAYNLNNDLDGRIRQGLSDNKLSGSWKEICPPPDVCSMFGLNGLDTTLNNETSLRDGLHLSKSEKIEGAVAITEHLGRWLQSRTPGFLPSKRQFRMAGLATLQMAQQLRIHARKIRSGTDGLLVTDSGTSHNATSGRIGRGISLKDDPSFDFQKLPGFTQLGSDTEEIIEQAKANGMHIFGWRDFMEAAVKWRQLSEPRDNVWWVDSLPMIGAQIMKVGLNTNMIANSAKSSRYFSYFNGGFEAMKKALKSTGYYLVNFENGLDDTFDVLTELTPAQKHLLDYAHSLEDLFFVANGQPFFVKLPVSSRVAPERILEGTRLMLRFNGDEYSFDFAINSAALNNRYEDYTSECEAVFKDLVFAVGDILDFGYRDRSLVSVLDSAEQKVLLKTGLEMFYYWVNWGPLTRGSSVTGHVSLLATLLAAGLEPSRRLPPKKQLDWEAMYAGTFDAFYHKVSPWFRHLKPSSISSEWLDGSDDRGIQDIFVTTRHHLAAFT